MTRTLPCLAFAILVLGLCGCGSGDPAPKQGDNPAASNAQSPDPAKAGKRTQRGPGGGKTGMDQRSLRGR